MDLVLIAKDAKAYERFLTGNPPQSENFRHTGFDKRKIVQEYPARGRTREERRGLVQDQKEFRARKRELRNKQIETRRNALKEPHYASGDLKRSGKIRAKVLHVTEKKVPKRLSRLAAGAAGAVPGALAGTLVGGPVGGAVGGAMGASAAYPAASYGLNVSTMKWNKEKHRPQTPYSQNKIQGKVWEKHRKAVARAHPEAKGRAEVMQIANRTIPAELPGAARRRIGAMGYGAKTVGRYAAPVAIGGALAGAAAGTGRSLHSHSGVFRAAAKRKEAAKRNKRLTRVGIGSALVGGASLAGIAARNKKERGD